MTALTPASFDVEGFERADDARIEVRGRWSGVRGRRFMRPTLTAVADGREQRILAVLDHKPWIAEEGEVWRAAFPWAADPASLHDAELTVAPDVTVPLAAPAAAAAAADRPRRPTRSTRSASPKGATRPAAGAQVQLGELERQCERLRVERDEALAAREAARAQRDSAVRERNRMLAERDGSQARTDEVTRQWELTAALGTRRTLERDAAANQRDDAASQRDRIARDRDIALEERDRTAQERDAAVAELECAAREATIALDQAEATIALDQAEATIAFEHAAAARALEQAAATEDWRPPIVSEQELLSHDLQLPLGDGAASGLWRARVLAVSALIVAVIVLLALVLAK